MCGICYVKRFDGKRAAKVIKKRYEKQKQRGTQGFGYLALDDDYLTSYRRKEKEVEILEALRNESANEIIFHHRFPTSTPNLKESAHPISVKNDKLKYDYFMVHNGVIWNDTALKEGHEKDGFTYNTTVTEITKTRKREIVESVKFNDSEVLAIELARAIDAGKDSIEARGSIAFIMLQCDKKSKKAIKLHFGRNYGSPLKYLVNEFMFSLCSEGEGLDVKEHVLHSWNYETSKIEDRPFIFGSSYNYGVTIQGDKDGYKTRSAHTSFGFEGDEDYEDLRRMGFRVVGEVIEEVYPRELGGDAKLLPAPASGEIIINSNDKDFDDIDWVAHYELISEAEDIRKTLASSTLDEEDRVYYEERLLDVEEEIKSNDEAYTRTLIQRSGQAG